eukprot:g5813.t1
MCGAGAPPPAAAAVKVKGLSMLRVRGGIALGAAGGPRSQPAAVDDGDVQLAGELLVHVSSLGTRGLALTGSSIEPGWVKLMFRICMVGGKVRLRGFRARVDAVRAAEPGPGDEKGGRDGRPWWCQRREHAPKPLVDDVLHDPEHGSRGIAVEPQLEELAKMYQEEEKLCVDDQVEARCYLREKSHLFWRDALTPKKREKPKGSSSKIRDSSHSDAEIVTKHRLKQASEKHASEKRGTSELDRLEAGHSDSGGKGRGGVCYGGWRKKASKHYPGVIARVPSISERSNGTVDAFDVRFEKSTLDGNSVPRGWIRK